MQLVHLAQVPARQGLHFSWAVNLCFCLSLLCSIPGLEMGHLLPLCGGHVHSTILSRIQSPLTLSSPGSVTRSFPGRPSAPSWGHSPAQPLGPPAPSRRQASLDGDPPSTGSSWINPDRCSSSQNVARKPFQGLALQSYFHNNSKTLPVSSA